MQLLKNARFEEGSPKYWQTYTTGNTQKYTYPEIGRIDGFSVTIEYKSRETGKMASYIQNIQIDHKKKYKLSGWVKIQNIIGTGACIRVDWKDSTGNYLSGSTIMTYQQGTTPWTYFEGDVVPNPNAAMATIVLDLSDCSGKARFDDISFSDLQVSSHPNMYLNQTDISAIKSRINTEPWKTAYNQFMTMVNNALNTPIQSVTFGEKTPPSGDKHDYWTDLPYSSDGVYNPNADRTDYIAAMKIRDSVRDLGLAYVLTDDSVKKTQYANKAIQLINGWCIDSTTKMNPKYTNEQSKVELSITMPGIFYGADLIWNYSGWNTTQKNQFVDWVKAFVNSAKTWAGQYDNNYEFWRLVAVSSGAIITGDSAILQDAFNRWKVELPKQMDVQGRMIKENFRTRGLTYSLYGILAMTNTSEIAKHNGVDLYNYKTLDGKCVELALDFHDYYCSDPNPPGRWIAAGYEEIHPELVDYSLWELAYTFKKKPGYKEVITVRGRPMFDKRIIGPVTLMHGSSFV